MSQTFTLQKNANMQVYRNGTWSHDSPRTKHDSVSYWSVLPCVLSLHNTTPLYSDTRTRSSSSLMSKYQGGVIGECSIITVCSKILKSHKNVTWIFRQLHAAWDGQQQLYPYIFIFILLHHPNYGDMLIGHLLPRVKFISLSLSLPASLSAGRTASEVKSALCPSMHHHQH